MSPADLLPVAERPTATAGRDHSFASATIAAHLRRGILGFGLLAVGVFLWPRVGLLALAPAAVGVVALRGCPTCWTIGLVQTVTRQRFRRDCDEGRCRLDTSRPGPAGPPGTL